MSKLKHLLEFIFHQKSLAWNRSNDAFIQYSTTSGETIETLMEKIRPAVMDKREFQYRERSIIIAPCEILGLSGFQNTEPNNSVLN